uniref:transposase n=1 Tax=Hutsoniella sourekii TaxID=87650 RepID=UPI003899109B
MIESALTPKGYLRKVTINPEWEYYKAKQRELLSDPEYSLIYSLRKTDVEPAFGHLKANLGFNRFHVRGIDKVHNEIGLALMATNMRKLALIFRTNQKTQHFYSCRIKIWVFLRTYLTASLDKIKQLDKQILVYGCVLYVQI